MSQTKSKVISFIDMHDEFQSFEVIRQELPELKEEEREKYSKINVDNNPRLKELVDGWSRGIYDEDPYAIGSMMEVIKNSIV